MLTRAIKTVRYLSTSGRLLASPQFCIVGSGPAGFYAAQGLRKIFPDAFIDVYEKLPVPFGLLRYGVAPDHPEVKNATNSFTNTAQGSRFSFNGNVNVGKDVTLEQLQEVYHAVILCTGADDYKKLEIPGEDLPNVLSARSFVGWYNSLPEHSKLNVNLDVETVAILGHGNVALDVARILLTKIDVLRKTDISDCALEVLSRSRVKRVVLLGRRGPLQVAFTTKELREMFTLDGCRAIVRRSDFAHIDKALLDGLQRPRRRLTELMIARSTTCSKDVAGDDYKVWELKFLRSPVEFLAAEDGTLKGLLLAINTLQDVNGNSQAFPTARQESLECGLALTSIGYRSRSIQPTLPFNDRKGVIDNEDGRVSGNTGVYCCGWVATGPVGVILSTMNDSFRLSRVIADDIKQGRLNVGDAKGGNEAVLSILKSKNIQVVTFEDWLKIDKEEQNRGVKLGKPREKVNDVEEMLRIAH